MPSLGTSPDVISYSSTIAAGESTGRWQLTLHLLGLMLANRVLPNVFSFNSAISACARVLEWEMALRLLQQMPEESRDVISYSSAINACDWDLAIQLLSAMFQQRISGMGW